MGILRKVKNSVRPHYLGLKLPLFKVIGPLRKFKVKDSLIISSETRGGSTWLMELIYEDLDTIINWEPLHELKGVVPDDFKWGPNPSIEEDNTNDEYKTLMKKILTYKLASPNSIKYCTLRELMTGKRVLTKFVRSNEILVWLVNNFDLKYKPVYLLRHPIAVARSQIRNFLDNEQQMPPFEIPDTVNAKRYEQHHVYLNTLKTRLERQVALWCIHNINVLNHPDHGKKWIVVYYEDLVINPNKELQKLVKTLELKLPEKSIDFNKASRSDYHNEFVAEKDSQIQKWRKGLSDDDLGQLQKVFDHFNIKIYSAFDYHPIKN